MNIQTALVSVSDKIGVVDFCDSLQRMGIKKILSTGGTAKLLSQSGIKVTEVSSYTGFPEMMDGRIKTLHPKIHGGLLALRENPSHVKKAKEHCIDMIDLLVVNLYPFKKTISNPNVHFKDAIENIDIGGPAMIRAAAKNFKNVVVLVDPDDYLKVLKELSNDGDVSYETRFYLAVKVFQTMSDYDGAIFNYLKKEMEKV